MKRIYSVISALVVTGSLFAGGLVTNTNQSALYTRLQSRMNLSSMNLNRRFQCPLHQAAEPQRINKH